MSIAMSPADAAREELEGFGGRLIGPSDKDYEEARAVYNAMIDRRPALIARCQNTADIADAIRFARAHGLDVSVRF